MDIRYIIQKCLEKGFTLESLEEAAQISPGSIKAWVRLPPRVNILKRIATILECPVDDLIDGSYREVEAGVTLLDVVHSMSRDYHLIEMDIVRCLERIERCRRACFFASVSVDFSANMVNSCAANAYCLVLEYA